LKFLLDTNVISEIRKREQAAPAVADWVRRTPVKDIGTSVVVLAEIRRGIEQKRRRDVEQADALDRWFARMRSGLGNRVLPIDEPIADIWARLGVLDPLPFVDGLLAATAIARGLTLVTPAMSRERACRWSTPSSRDAGPVPARDLRAHTTEVGLSERSHPDAARLDDGEMASPIFARSYQVGEPPADITGPRHRHAQ